MEFCVKKFDELSNIELYNILKLRSEVFVVEQKSIYVDMDDVDINCLHVFYKENDKILAYLRVINYDNVNNIVKIGRVISKSRRSGAGTKLLRDGIDVAGRILGAKRILVDAQCYIKSFYAKQGFTEISDIHDIDGIPHVMMELIL